MPASEELLTEELIKVGIEKVTHSNGIKSVYIRVAVTTPYGVKHVRITPEYAEKVGKRFLQCAQEILSNPQR